MLTLMRLHQQQVDQAYTALTGLPLLLLMEQAAFAVSRYCIERIPESERIAASILVIAGKGQNGGDAWACARQLAAARFTVTCLDAFPGEKLSAEAEINRQAWQNLGYPVLNLSADSSSAEQLLQNIRQPRLIVDGLFGTGFRLDRPLSATVRRLTDQVKAWRQQGSWVVSIDLPSGVDADSGQMAEGAITADATVTLVRPKTGICHAPGRFAAGQIVLDNLGISDTFLGSLFAGQNLPEWIDPEMIRSLKTDRHPNSHKGSFGRVLILGGSPGLPGAASLAANAASRSGAGLVYLGTGESVAAQTLAAVSEALLTALPEHDPEQLSVLLDSLIANKQVVAIGPGAGQASWLHHALTQAIQKSPALVLDADGLNAVAADFSYFQNKLRNRRPQNLAPAVLTPHPGEFGRLAPDLDWQDRQNAALELARRMDAIVLLKGASTVIADPEGRVWINPTGNPGLAKGGSGDVLCGLIAGLLAQGLPPFEAAAAGAYLHGLAADLAADLKTGGTGYRALLPSDVLHTIGRAFETAGWEDRPMEDIRT